MREGSPPPAAAAKQQGAGRSRSSSSRLHQMLSSQQQQQQQHRREQSIQQQQQQQQQRQRKPPEPLRRAVADCLSASHHPPSFQPLRTLQDYLANSSTIHFAYTVLLEHAIAERDRSPAVVIKCVSLLKRYLFRYVPSIATLQQIDSFCAALIRESEAAAEKKSNNSGRGGGGGGTDQSAVVLPTSTVFASESLVKSLVYVRAVVARHLPGVSLHQQSFKLQPLQLSPLHFAGSSNNKNPSTPAPALLLGLASVEDGSSSEFIALDLLKWRWIARKGTQLWTPSPVMLDSGGIARPQVEILNNLEQGVAAFWLANAKHHDNHFIRASTAAAIADAAATKSHLRDVAASKRHPSSRWGGEPLPTLRKRQRPLFQYRCYSKQQPLRLSDADMEEVIAAVCAEATAPVLLPVAQSGETANVAGSVLIKLVIDMYLADARTAAPLTLSILQVMLNAGPVVVRVRAFDLVLNLGIHAHLLEPMQSDDPDASQGSSVFPEGGRVYGTPQAVGEFESWLFTIVCEMLLLLVQLEEKGEAVWAAALSTLLYLVCDRGHIKRERLERVDIRVLRRLLDVSRDNAWADEIHCRLIRMLCNLLLTGDTALDDDKLEAVGGMEFIFREYALAQSSESKRNLFAVILECAISQLRGSWDSSRMEDEVQAIATALVLAGAPESLSVALKHKVSGVGGRISKSITKALDRDIENGRLNVTVLEELTRLVDMLVETHGSLDEELRDLISVSMDEQEDVSYLGSRGWTILHALLHSPRCDYRQHGQLWLKHLLETEAECLHRRQHKEEDPESAHKDCIYKMVEQARLEASECTTTTTTTSASQLLFGLLKSRKHYVRQEFFIVFEHLLSQCQRMGCTEQEHGNMLVWLMSGSLWHFISANDTNRVNVLQMCNLMLSQILCLRYGEKQEEGVAVSSPAALFIREEAAAPHKFVCAMPTALFYWPLMQLAGASMDDVSLGIAVGSKGGGNVPGCASDVRAALLLLLVAKCTLQQAALEEVGGQEFFRSLLDDTDARIAYYTASFLIKRMMLEDADGYQRVLHNLVFKAQQKNDEKLLENPYLQIGGILQQDPAPILIQDDSC